MKDIVCLDQSEAIIADLTGSCEKEVGGVDAGLDEVIRQVAAEALNPAVRHDHLDLLP